MDDASMAGETGKDGGRRNVGRWRDEGALFHGVHV